MQVGAESDLLEVREHHHPESGGDATKQIRRKKKFVSKSASEVESCTIYVENLPSQCCHDDLRSYFSRFGPVVYVSLPRFTGGPTKGFAFLEFEDAACVERALQAFGTTPEAKGEVRPEELYSIKAFQKEQGETPEAKKDDKDDKDEEDDEKVGSKMIN